VGFAFAISFDALAQAGLMAAKGHELGGFEQSFFYSDSRNDIPLLEQVTHPVATNPDAQLQAVARERGWPVIQLFSRDA
jgi:phosphoserine phosphatase